MDEKERKRLFEDFKSMISTESVVGEPIYLGDAVIVPFVDVSFGFGSGTTGPDGKSGGEAGGGKMVPTAVLILKGERVELFSIKNAASTTAVDKVLNMVPEIISHFRKRKEVPLAEEVTEAAAMAAPEAAEEAPAETERCESEAKETEEVPKAPAAEAAADSSKSN